jgi:hypothetical protein
MLALPLHGLPLARYPQRLYPWLDLLQKSDPGSVDVQQLVLLVSSEARLLFH